MSLAALLLYCLLHLAAGSSSQSAADLQQCAYKANQAGTCLVVGKFNPYDRLLFNQDEEKYAFPFIKRSEEFVFPSGEKATWSHITFVKVTNKMAAGKEGSVTLTNGGVGHQNVSLYLESQRGEGYNFYIEIRGVDK